ncbi:MAG: hypothetical protein ABIH70_03120 [Chloroflexota bacterium]
MALADIPSFGDIDADSDKLLEQCFEDHEAYRSALLHDRFLVLGRKGSGKTAIFRKIVNLRKHDVFSYGHTFTDYPWHHHDKQASIGVPEEERFVHSWKYLIFMTLSKILLNLDGSQPWSLDAIDQLSRLERFVVDSYGTRDPDITQIFSPARRLQFNSSFELPLGGFTITVGTKSIPIEQLPTVIQEVNRNLSDAVIASLNPACEYYVCFDQLDLGFDPTNQSYQNRLVGLLLAARDVNFKARQSGKKLSVIIFLRDDIYQILRFEDKNKLTEACSSLIQWDTPQTDRTLKQLMEKRFATVMNIAEDGAWNIMFDEAQLMTGKQSKYHHITDRTFLRPRDIIKFCNEILVSYKRRPLLASGVRSDKFDNRDIQVARDAYSAYFLKELDDEIFKHFPQYESYVEILKGLDSLYFTMDDFSEALFKRKQILPEKLDSISVLKTLFDFSIISYYSAGGSGYGGADYIWRYKNSRAQFNEAATKFRIHPGFREALGVKKFTKSG